MFGCPVDETITMNGFSYQKLPLVKALESGLVPVVEAEQTERPVCLGTADVKNKSYVPFC